MWHMLIKSPQLVSVQACMMAQLAFLQLTVLNVFPT